MILEREQLVGRWISLGEPVYIFGDNGTGEYRHARDKCMNCDKSPTIEVLWANGKGHAWFCAKCYDAWKKESDWHEVDYEKEIEHGIARMKFSDRNSPKSLREDDTADYAYPIPDTIVVKNFVSIVGSVAKGDPEADDVDILIRADRVDGQGGPGFFIRAEDVEIPIRKLFDKSFELHWVANPQGAHDDYKPLADLILRMSVGAPKQVVEVAAVTSSGVRIDLGCGENKPEGYIGVDKRQLEGVDLVHDLDTGLPFPDDYAQHIRANHFLEHARDPVFIMSEIYRVLVPRGTLAFEYPSTEGPGAFADPTHVSYWNRLTLYFFTQDALREAIGFKGKFEEVDVEQIEEDGKVYVRGILRAVPVMEEQEKEKGPGRGWWGPPVGTHGPGSLGGSITEEQLKKLTPGLDDGQRANLLKQFAGVPAEHLRSVEEITTSAPPGYSVADRAFVRSDGREALGMADKGARKLHLHPTVLSDPHYAQALHEVGHFKFALSTRLENAGLTGVIPGLRNLSDARLGDYGLSRYSLRNERELLADTYKTWLVGSSRQWNKLSGVWAGQGVDMSEELGSPPDRWDRG